MSIPPSAIRRSRRTIASYESFAAHYDTLVGPVPPPNVEASLRRIVDIVRPGGFVLEIGSGPGRDADFLERLGVVVRRTDATKAFLNLQRARGKHGDLLNVLTDELGGPYDAIVALCVLIHIGRDQTPLVLGKIAAALRPGGAFYVSVRDGKGETTGAYQMTYWSGPEFKDCLLDAGMPVEWLGRHVDSSGEAWLSYIARKP